MKRGAAIFIAAAALLAANGAVFAATDVPQGDWSYAAVQDLASKGLVQGYPKTASLFGDRTVNRYEMAAIVSRIVDELNARPAAFTAQSPGTREEIAKLIESFRTELAVMGTNISDLKLGVQALTDTSIDEQKQIDALKKQVKGVESESYGNTQLHSYSITGYIQTRFVDARSGSRTLFPENKGNALSGVYNGNYGEGGTSNSFEVRRARIVFLGRPTVNSYYRLQLDASGTTSSSSSSQVKVKEAGDYYTPGDGSSKYPTFGVGQFATPFGYILPASTSTTMTPERPLAFSESSSGYGLFNNQDYDKGAKISYGPGNIKFVYAAINGSGQNTENFNNHIDSVAHLNYTGANGIYNIGASYYAGEIYQASANKQAVSPKKDLYGLDAQIKAPCGAFLMGEYVAGTYESRYFFNQASAGSAPTYTNDAFVKGNQVAGYYIWGGYTLNQSSSRPWTIGADYDVFQRSKKTDGGAASTDTLATGNTTGANASYDDVNWGFGTLYNLDKATRLRLWVDEPVSIAHQPGTVAPQKVPLVTGEVQLSF